MPPNDDRYPGALPLYSAHALADPESAMAAGGGSFSDEQQAKICPYYVRLGMLSPPSVYAETPPDSARPPQLLPIEHRRVPPPSMLEREASLLRAAETLAGRSTTDAVDRLVSWACLAALGDIASVDFELAGEHRVAKDSVRVHQRGRREGKKALEAIDWSGEEGAAAGRKLLRDYGGQSWILLSLDGGERVVSDLAARAGDLEGRLGLHAALLVWPRTRAHALKVMAGRPLHEQVEVMQGLFQTSDRHRYLAGSVELDGTAAEDEASARFLNGYRVFSRLASRLWDGDKPADTLAAFEHDAAAIAIDLEWQAALLDYYARNTLTMYAQTVQVSAGAPRAAPARAAGRTIVGGVAFISGSRNSRPRGGSVQQDWQRPGGMELVHLLRVAAEKNRHPSLDPLRRCLLYIEAQGHLDPKTLADGQRLN